MDQLKDTLNPTVNNLTEAIGTGTQKAFNEIIESIINSTGVQNQYMFYLESVCEGGGTVIARCASYGDMEASKCACF